jgi:hypothetical protein
LFTINPYAISPELKEQYPRLAQTLFQYTPAYKSLSLAELGNITINTNAEDQRVVSSYKEVIAIPVIAGVLQKHDEQRVKATRQRSFEDQILRSPSDRSRYRRIFTNIGFHVVYPDESNPLGLDAFMAVYNGSDEHPLVIRGLETKSLRVILSETSDAVLNYLFQG